MKAQQDSAAPTGSTAWWRDAVVYQIYVRSFADSDGDGVGDLPGVRSRLGYLADLGVDAIWCTPFFLSPQADGGYDVTDYRAVDPMFGQLGDVEELVAEAHRLGIRVIMDIVPNHTSDQHAWFRAALAGDAEARKRYHFRRGRGANGELPPNDWSSVFGGPAWTRVDSAGTAHDSADDEWYLHLFAPQQPDLNWDNPEVLAEFESVLRFWLDRGIDGFRIDVAHGMVKADGLPDIGSGEQAALIGRQVVPFFDQDGVHDVHRAFRRVLDSYQDERIAVAEAWASTPERLARYVRPDELHQAFNFHFLDCPWDADALRTAVNESLTTTRAVGATTTWVLGNHDVVRPVTRYGGGERGLARARALAMLMLALPGSTYIYQGEELGLPEVRALPDEARQDPAFSRLHRGGGANDATATTDASTQEPTYEGQGWRDGCRVPIPWSGEQPSYGFGPGGSWLPQPSDWARLSVQAQQQDPDSTLALYRSALAIRRGMPASSDATISWDSGVPRDVLAFSRPGLTCTLNVGTTETRLPQPGRLLLSSGPVRIADGFVQLPADTCVWWET